MRKKLLTIFAISILAAGTAYAQGALTSEDERELDELHGRIARSKQIWNRFMKEMKSTYDESGSLLADFGQEIKVDIGEDKNNMVVRADMPGMEKDKIDITLERNRYLKLSGTRDVMKKETRPGAVKQERSVGSFKRVLELPAEGMSSGIKASYKDGVLEVIIPKKAPSKEETVRIKVI